MPTLSQGQIDALRRSFLETLAERAREHLRRNVEWAVFSIPDPILLRMTRAMVRRAILRGLRLDTAILAYIHIAFVVAPNFDEHPLVRDVEARYGVGPDDLPFVLGDALTTENWRTIRKSSDPNSWELGTTEAGNS